MKYWFFDGKFWIINICHLYHFLSVNWRKFKLLLQQSQRYNDKARILFKISNFSRFYPFNWVLTMAFYNPLSANPTKWSNTLKQFVRCSQRIVWVRLTILWSWRLNGWWRRPWYYPILCRWSLSIPTENIGKTEVFCFKRVYEETCGIKWVNKTKSASFILANQFQSSQSTRGKNDVNGSTGTITKDFAFYGRLIPAVSMVAIFFFGMLTISVRYWSRQRRKRKQ